MIFYTNLQAGYLGNFSRNWTNAGNAEPFNLNLNHSPVNSNSNISSHQNGKYMIKLCPHLLVEY